MYEAHDVLLCIAEGARCSQDQAPARDAGALLQDRGRDARAVRRPAGGLDNTLVIAQRCAYMPEPRKPILPPFRSEGGSASDELRRQAEAGLERRLAGR